jgi:hypothetical protein
VQAVAQTCEALISFWTFNNDGVVALGAGLHACYQHNGFPFPGSRKGLPYAYVAIHDVQHVIGGYASNPDHALLIALDRPPPADVRRDLNVLEASSETP